MMKGRKSVRLDTAHQLNRRIKLTILVIHECMELDMIECKKVWSNTDWYGDHLEFNRSRTGGDLGIGIFSSKYTFSISEFHNTGQINEALNYSEYKSAQYSSILSLIL